MPQIWIELTIYVVVGMLAGGLTNTVAVWMLFNPKPVPLFGGVVAGSKGFSTSILR